MAKRRNGTTCREPGCTTEVTQSNRTGYCRTHANSHLATAPLCAHPGCDSTYNLSGGVCQSHRHQEHCQCQFCVGDKVKVVQKSFATLSNKSGDSERVARVTMAATPWE